MEGKKDACNHCLIMQGIYCEERGVVEVAFNSMLDQVRGSVALGGARASGPKERGSNCRCSVSYYLVGI